MSEIKIKLGDIERLSQGLRALVQITNLLPGTAYRVFKLDKAVGAIYEVYMKKRNEILDKYGIYSVEIPDKGKYTLDKSVTPYVWRNGGDTMEKVPDELMSKVVWTAKDASAVEGANAELKSLGDTDESISEATLKLSQLRTVDKDGHTTDVGVSPVLMAMLNEIVMDDTN